MQDSRKDMPAKSAVEIDDSVLRTLAESQVTRDGKKDDEYEKAVQDALVPPLQASRSAVLAAAGTVLVMSTALPWTWRPPSQAASPS